MRSSLHMKGQPVKFVFIYRKCSPYIKVQVGSSVVEILGPVARVDVSIFNIVWDKIPHSLFKSLKTL